MRFVRTLAALAAVAVMSMNSVEAGAIVGSQGFSFSGVRVTTPAPPAVADLATAQVFSLRGMTTNDSVNGAFSDDGTSSGNPVAGSPGINFGNVQFNVLSGLSFGNASFGTFNTISVQKVNDAMYYVVGTFTPGTLFPGLTANTAEFDISLTQAGGAGQSISGSGTLITPAFHNAVPEPSSLALACVGGLIGLVAVRRNRK